MNVCWCFNFANCDDTSWSGSGWEGGDGGHFFSAGGVSLRLARCVWVRGGIEYAAREVVLRSLHGVFFGACVSVRYARYVMLCYGIEGIEMVF